MYLVADSASVTYVPKSVSSHKDYRLVFLGSDGKEVSRISRRLRRTRAEVAAQSNRAKEFTWHFILPKGVARGYFLIYHNLLEEMRLTRIGGQEKFKDVGR